jgi:hypothetical protein
MGHRGRRLLPAVAAGLACCALVGCGSSSPGTRSAGPSQGRFPANQPSARRKAEQQALHKQVLARLHSPSKKFKPGLPSYLPKDSTKVNRVVTATPAHPQLAIAGDSVVLSLAGGRTRATMNGPLYDNKYVGTNQPIIPATFLLTFSRTHGTIPLAPKDFTILDERGNNIVPRFTVKGGGAMPSKLTADHPLTLVMSTTIAVGDGSIVYDPPGSTQAGHRPLAGWDFIVEDD